MILRVITKNKFRKDRIFFLQKRLIKTILNITLQMCSLRATWVEVQFGLEI